MENPVFLWNLALTAVSAFFLVVWYMAQDKFKKIEALETMLNQTRVEVVRDHITKAEVQKITEHIDARFNRLEEKIDRLIQRG